MKHLAALVLACGLCARALGADVPPDVARMLEHALDEAENLRKQLPTLQYDATLNVQEWDGSGHLRGTAKAVAVMRPGDPHPMTFVSREVHGKVKLPSEKGSSKEDEDDKKSLHDFAQEHQISERFEFVVEGAEEIAGERASRIRFTPKPNQPEKSRADRFLDSIAGKAWVSEGKNRVVKFQMQLQRPLQLFWIIAVLKELTLDYELVQEEPILGQARLKVLFALSTPVYSIRQQHDVTMGNFRPRETTAAREPRG